MLHNDRNISLDHTCIIRSSGNRFRINPPTHRNAACAKLPWPYPHRCTPIRVRFRHGVD